MRHVAGLRHSGEHNEHEDQRGHRLEQERAAGVVGESLAAFVHQLAVEHISAQAAVLILRHDYKEHQCADDGAKNCARTYAAHLVQLTYLKVASARLTAGFMCPPEIGPVTCSRAKMTKPNERLMATVFPGLTPAAPQHRKTKKAVEKNSATTWGMMGG